MQINSVQALTVPGQGTFKVLSNVCFTRYVSLFQGKGTYYESQGSLLLHHPFWVIFYCGPKYLLRFLLF